MKKLFFGILAMAAFAACSNEEPVASLQGDAIAFGDAFVDNAVRAIYDSKESLEADFKFTVFGNVKATSAPASTDPVALYGDGALVERKAAALGAAWTCSVTRYWTPSCTFNFAAVANHDGVTTDANGLPATIKYTANATSPKDLIWDNDVTVETNDQSVPEGLSNGIVAFTMEHLLSRVQVSFQNKVPQTEYTYDITNVKVITWKNGIYDVTNGWAQGEAGNIELPYETALTGLVYDTKGTSVGAELVIPTSAVSVSFTYELKFKGTSLGAAQTVTKAVTASGFPTKGHSYNILVELALDKEIKFSVADTTQLGWGADTTTTIQ